jgi:hypothetical protein
MTLSEKSATFRDHALASSPLQWWENCRWTCRHECALRQPNDAKGVPLDDRRAEICVTTPKIFIRAVGATEMMAENANLIKTMTIATSGVARTRSSTKPSRTPSRRPIRFQSCSRWRAGTGPASDSRKPASCGVQRGDDRLAFVADDVGDVARVLIAGRTHIEDHPLYLLAGIAPHAGSVPTYPSHAIRFWRLSSITRALCSRAMTSPAHRLTLAS